MTDKITIPVEFTIGTLEELGLTLRQEWLSAEHDGAELDLTCGAGLGSGVLEASCHLDGRSLYARTDIRVAARAIFSELERRVRSAGEPETRGENEER
jgi:hypothetical protein